METSTQPAEEAPLSKENSTTELERDPVVLETVETARNESISLEDQVIKLTLAPTLSLMHSNLFAH